MGDVDSLVERLLAGNRRALSRILTLIDRQGTVRYVRIGPLTFDQLAEQLEKVL